MTRPPRTPPPRLPAFAAVPVKRRADGWTPVRQAEFIGMLAETGSVSAAAAFVGMARETAYRLRRKPGAEEFARAWDAAVAISGVAPSASARRAVTGEARTEVPPKVSPDELWRRIVDGRWRPVVQRGKYVGSVRKADNSALLSHLAQLDRSLRAERKALRRQARSHAHKNLDPRQPAERSGRGPR